MAIVTISQIKHRRGQMGVDPMPQLASAEFGWGIDQQELYIGNGTLVEGAPAIGNTEILTEHSNLTALISDYTYAGPFSGATMNTDSGAGVITRTNDDHSDDRVDVRAFGAVGAGGTSDLVAIKQAIYQHTSSAPASNRYWTTIYIPAGTYNIDGPLALPSNVRLVGDGFNSTIINMTSANAAVLEIGDTVVDTIATNVYIQGIGFTATQAISNVATIHSANNIVFDRCAFNGASADTTLVDGGVGETRACVLFSEAASPATNPTFAIKFLTCSFNTMTYGIASGIEGDSNVRQDISDVVVENCRFDNLYKGIVIGPNVDIATYDIPTGWRVSLSLFDNITREGIHSYQGKKITSGINHFADVGNLQAATPTYSNIEFGDTGGVNPLNTGLDLTNYENCYSIGDTFDRTDADDLTIKRVTTNALNSYSITPFEIFHGSLHVEPGRLIRLIDNTTAATGITFDNTKYQGAIIDYQITRGATQRRTGTLTLAIGTTNVLMDDFIELALTTGVTFTSSGAGTVSIDYVTTDSTLDGTFSYSIRHLTNVLAPALTP